MKQALMSKSTENSLVIDSQGTGTIVSELRDFLAKNFVAGPSCLLKAHFFDTKLGSMVGIADENGLYLLEFVERRELKKEIARLCQELCARVIVEKNAVLRAIQSELTSYFSGKALTFNAPVHIMGTAFQKRVWQALQKIPVGQTLSYLELAENINHASAFRAVALANSANKLALIVPCHRVIRANGDIGGYAGGVMRKKWLINHEKIERDR